MTVQKEIMNLIYICGFFKQAILHPSRFEVFFCYISYYFNFNFLQVCLHLFFFFYKLYLSALPLTFTVFNARCKTCNKSLIPPISSVHLPLFLFFPPTKNKKMRVASNFCGDFIWFSFNYLDRGGVCKLENFGKL